MPASRSTPSWCCCTRWQTARRRKSRWLAARGSLESPPSWAAKAPMKRSSCVPASPWELPMQQLQDEFDRNGDLLRMLLRYAQSLMTQVAQTAVCNRHHSIDQQLCSWLLFALDRLPGNRLAVTQELIANMLGVRRESITGAAVKLQRKGVLEYCRGHVTVLDRSKLEQLACECYALVKKEAGAASARSDWVETESAGTSQLSPSPCHWTRCLDGALLRSSRGSGQSGRRQSVRFDCPRPLHDSRIARSATCRFGSTPTTTSRAAKR